MSNLQTYALTHKPKYTHIHTERGGAEIIIIIIINELINNMPDRDVFFVKYFKVGCTSVLHNTPTYLAT